MNDISKYINLPYNYLIQPINDESGIYYYARVLELDGCQSTGKTFEEAYNNLKAAMGEWISLKMEKGNDIPLPCGSDQFSGQFMVKIPKSLHYKLVIEAEQEDVTLNQYVLYKLCK